MLELTAGIIVTLVALALIIEPLLRPAPPPVAQNQPDEADFTELEESESPRVQALLALKEIEFDRATGKLSDDDYQDLKAKYSETALAAMESEGAERQRGSGAAGAGGEVGAGGDEAERLIARFKRPGGQCQTCGPRPELGAVFCSSCGRSLIGPGVGPRCWICGVELPDGAKFCQACGGSVAA